MRPMISYLIPCYNHARYLPVLLEYISLDIKELNVPAEVIIVDDGSADDSVNIIKEWALEKQNDFKITTRFQENKGLTAVLNWMTAQAQGDYVRLCASDDIISVGSTQILYDHFKKHSQSLCILADGVVIDEKGQMLHPSSITYYGGHVQRLLNPSQIVKELITHWCVAGPCHLIKRSHFENMRYNESDKIDDFDLFLSLLREPQGIVFIDEKVCSYRRHQTNTSRTPNIPKRIENIGYFLSIINRYLDRKIFIKELLPLKYKNQAKIYFLQKKYVRCSFNMGISLFLKFKSELFS